MSRTVSLLLAVLVMISGCARFALVTSSEISPEVRQAVAEQNFNRAWRVFERTQGADMPDDERQALRDMLEMATRQFEKDTIDMARQLADAGRWSDAFEVLKEARSRWRQSEAIQGARKELRQREALLFAGLEADLLLEEARWLAAKRPVLDRLETLAREDATETAEHWRARMVQLAGQLTTLGERFAAEQDWVRTRDLLAAARNLSGQKALHPQLALAEKHLATEASKARRIQEQQVQAKARKLLDAYDQSMSLADLLTAREYIKKNNDRGLLDQYATRLEAICNKRFRQGLSEGEALYAQGRYQEAYQTWQNIAQIYPGDAELEKKIERARKVLENLKSLSSS